jgi:hypothetical protein
MLGRMGRIAAPAISVAALALAAVPVAASGSAHGKSRHRVSAHAALASCGQAEEYVAAYLNSQYSAVPGGVIHSYTLLGWWQGCHGPYENVKGRTQWATYPRVRYNVTGDVNDGQVNVDPYGNPVYTWNLQE